MVFRRTLQLLLIVAFLPAFIHPCIGQEKKKNITLEDIWKNRKFRSKPLDQLRSMNDGLHYTTLDVDRGGQAINKYSYKTSEKVATIARSVEMVPEGKKEPVSIAQYTFSPDETKLLIVTDVEKIYRHSTRETNYVYDLNTKKLSLLSPGAKQRYASFSPRGNMIAFVRTNNIFIADLESGLEIQVTADGRMNHIINGATDWVYEEEFSFDKAFFWSPDGKKIAYYQFDENKVKEFSMAMFGTLYPEDYQFKYPKAGERNAKVSIYVFDVEKRNSFFFDLGKEFEYLPRIKWTKDPNLLSITVMNRHQSKLELLIANAATGKSKVIFNESCDTYIDITDNLTFLDNKQQFIWTSEHDGFNHIYLYNMQGKLLKQITKGNWDVTKFIGINNKTGTVYYISAESSPMERDLYSIKTSGAGKKKLSARKGTNDARFSKNFKYYINFHSDANTPKYISLHNSSGKELRTIIDNSKLRKRLAEYNLSEKEFFTFITSENITLNGWMIKPPNFTPDKKFPVLMYIYGGPVAQTVLNSWSRNYTWHQMLAQKGFIIASVDNRGTGSRGRDFKNCTYRQLGKLETTDLIETARYLRALPYVDGQRIGIWGWSYGGYMSSLCITKGADLFKLAIAVAPVTNWRYYDTIYTERFLQTPQENPKGYDDNSPINFVDKLEGKYLLIHGTADDNVHFQNTVEMVNALIKANKQFDLYIYPDRNHSIYGANARLHLFTKMTNFILENL